MQGPSPPPRRDESNITAPIRHRCGWCQAGRANFSLRLSLPAWSALALGLIVSIALFSWVYRQEQRSERANFERRTQVRVTAVQQGLAHATDALQAVNLFFVANGGNVSREQFHTFAQALRARHPYIAAFAYDRLVAGNERPAFEAKMRTPYPDFGIAEMVDGKRVVSRLKDRYRVIDYVEPMTGSEGAFGLDVSSTPFAAAHAGAPAALLASLLTTLALTAYLQAIATRTQGIQQLVERRTRELTQVSEALSLSEARLRGIFDSATDAIITADESQTIVMANAAAAHMFRCTPGALIGAPLERLIPERQRQMHRREVQAFGDTQAQARHMGEARDVMGLRADGQEFPLDAAISHLSVGGRRLYTAILRDITERRSAEAALRESEERLRRLLMLLPVGVFVYSGRGSGTRISFANEAAQRLVGTGEANLLGRSPLDFIHPDSLDQVKQRLLAMQGGTTPPPLTAMKIRRANGAVRLVQATAAPVTIAGQTSIVVILHDVTELQQAQHALKRSHADLQRLVAAQDSVQDNERKRIARELHDDLQQTLAGLKMYLVAIGEHLAQAPARAAPLLAEAIRLTSAAIDSTRRIVRDLRPQVLDDLGLVPALEVLTGQFSQRTGIACYLEVQGVEVQGEAGQPELESPAVASCLYRVAQEALTNVAKHAQASTVQMRLTRAAPERLVLRIRDNGSGSGISASDRRKPGSFGLLGMHERVRALGGVLHIDSQPGSGTTLEVSIPVAATALRVN